MNIAICTDLFYPRLEGGGEIHTYNVAKHLIKFGHEVTVLCAKTSYFSQDSDHMLANEETVDGIHIIRARNGYQYGSTLRSLPALREMYQHLAGLISSGKVDIVNFTFFRPWVPSYFAAKGHVPCVPTVHLTSEGFALYKGWMHYDGGTVGGIAQRAVESAILRAKYPLVIAVSETQRALLSRFFPPEKIRVVYNGVDLQTYDSIRSEGKKPYQVIFIGWLKRRKNVLDAIRAVEIARHDLRDLRLLILSGGGELEPLVKDLCAKRDYIEYHKKVSDVEKVRLLKESSLLLFPTLKEGFSLVPLEALACRTPFLAYNIPEMRELYDMSKGGVLVDGFDFRELARRLVSLLKERDLLLTLAESGRKCVEERLTWEAVARRENDAFEDAISAFQTADN